MTDSGVGSRSCSDGQLAPGVQLPLDGAVKHEGSVNKGRPLESETAFRASAVINKHSLPFFLLNVFKNKSKEICPYVIHRCHKDLSRACQLLKAWNWMIWESKKDFLTPIKWTGRISLVETERKTLENQKYPKYLIYTLYCAYICVHIYVHICCTYI